MKSVFNALTPPFDKVQDDLADLDTKNHSDLTLNNNQDHTDYLKNDANDTTSGILTAKGFKTTNLSDITVNHVDLSETLDDEAGFVSVTGTKIKGTFDYEDSVAGSGLFLNAPIVDLSTTLTKGAGFLLGTNLSGKSYYNFSATESGVVTASNPIFKISYTGPNYQGGDGVLNVSGTSTTDTGSFIACKTTAQNSGDALTIGYRGWAQGTGTSTATIIGVEGYAVPVSTITASVAVQGNPKPVGTLVADKIMAFRAASGHILGYGNGKTSLILTTSSSNNRPIDITPNHCDFLNNSAEIYAEGMAEIHGRIYADDKITLADKALLGTPVAGTIEFDDDRLYITNVGTQRAIDRTSGVVTSTQTVDGDAAADGTTETTLFTGTIGANDFKAGNLIKIRTNGVVSTANAAQVLTLRVYIGSSLIASTTITGSTFSSEPWDLDATLIVRSVGVSGSISTHSDIEAGGSVASSTSAQSSTIETINTTTSEDITVTGQWTAASASNVVDAYQGYLEFKN